jgi:hypothetical protein
LSFDDGDHAVAGLLSILLRRSIMPLFHLGSLEVTPSASAALAAAGADQAVFFIQHQQDDWGVEDEDMQQENALTVQQNRPIYFIYKLSDDTTILVVTAADRETIPERS